MLVIPPNQYRPARDPFHQTRHFCLLRHVRTSLCLQNIKKKFPMVVQRCNEVVNRAAKLGGDASIDVDQLALRVTLEVIGLVSSHTNLSANDCSTPPATTAQQKHTNSSSTPTAVAHQLRFEGLLEACRGVAAGGKCQH
jgi:hypothetical protein